MAADFGKARPCGGPSGRSRGWILRPNPASESCGGFSWGVR